MSSFFRYKVPLSAMAANVFVRDEFSYATLIRLPEFIMIQLFCIIGSGIGLYLSLLNARDVLRD